MVDQAIISDMGAVFSEDGTVETFQNDKEALAAADTGVAVKPLCLESYACVRCDSIFPSHFDITQTLPFPRV